MPRIARIIAEGYPHHIIQRGNRRQKVFFQNRDYQEYLKLLRQYSAKNNLSVAAYCLMPNHVHIVAIPSNKEGLAKAIGETHRNYTRMINFRENWRGYLWQGRFSSYIMDRKHLYTAVKYILNNPVKAKRKITENALDYHWSSIHYHIGKKNIPWLKDDILQEMIDDWSQYLNEDQDNKQIELLKKHERTGRPLGDNNFIEILEKKLGISLKKKKPGPKKRKRGN
ncbi:MAG: transposase [Candidatus Omnitrophica bacterium]|nr:transposase [Candidatus Omnitrophota bacterium]